MKTKEEIRQHYLSLRSHISLEIWEAASTQICQHLLSSDVYQNAIHIGAYQAIRKEISLQKLIENAFSTQKKIYLPVIRPNCSLDFFTYEKNDLLKSNRFQILEPVQTTSFPVNQLDLLLVPLVAFDAHGGRMGWGKGYYDRVLLKQRAKAVIGVGYTFQRYPAALPNEQHDALLDGVVTENGLTFFS